MNLDHLKYFVDAAQGGGISHAAKLNFVTQSAVSRAISKLEEELGIELVLHKQNRFQLTEAGETVLLDSLPLLDAVSRLKRAASDHVDTLRGPLRIGGNQAVISRLVGPLLPKIEAKHPAIRPDVRIGNTDQVQRMIEQFEIDFGIVVDDGEVGKVFHRRKVYSGDFVLVKSPGLRISEIPNATIVSRTRKGGLSERYAREFEKAYRRPFSPKLVIPSWQVIMDLALSGFGCALVPRFICDAELKARKLEIVSHKVKPLSFELCAIVSKGRTFPKNAQALFECFPSV